MTVGLSRLEVYRCYCSSLQCSFSHLWAIDGMVLSSAAVDHFVGLGHCLTFHSSLSLSKL